MEFLKKLKIKLPYDPAIPLVGIYLEETRIQKDTCTPMFIAVLFLIARTFRKLPKCPSTEERIKKDMVHIYNGILLSHKKIPSAATWMDLEIAILSEVKSERERQIYDIAYCGI